MSATRKRPSLKQNIIFVSRPDISKAVLLHGENERKNRLL